MFPAIEKNESMLKNLSSWSRLSLLEEATQTKKSQ